MTSTFDIAPAAPCRHCRYSFMNRTLNRLMCMVAMALFFAPALLHAQSTEPADTDSLGDSRRWTLSLEGFGTADLTNRDVKMAGPLVGLYYDLNKSFAVGLELGGMHVWQDDDTNTVVGNLFLKNYLFEANDTRFFIDFGGGIFRAGERVPEQGTHFNTTIQVGFGFEHPFNEDVSLIGGLRYYHLSNARRRGPDRNPSLNGPGIYVGLLFRL